MSDGNYDPTIGETYETMTDAQKDLVYKYVGFALIGIEVLATKKDKKTYRTMNVYQKIVFHALIGMALNRKEGLKL